MRTIENNSGVFAGEDNNANAPLIDSLKARIKENNTEPATDDNINGKETETDQEIQRAIAHYKGEVLGGIDSLIESTEILRVL